MRFETVELSPRIGTEIRAGKTDLLKGGLREEIRDLLEQRGILLFRGLGLTEEEQLEFSSTIGEVFDQGEKGIFRVTLDRSITPQADYLEATTFWHIDGAHDRVPTRASVLTARVLTDDGGRSSRPAEGRPNSPTPTPPTKTCLLKRSNGRKPSAWFIRKCICKALTTRAQRRRWQRIGAPTRSRYIRSSGNIARGASPCCSAIPPAEFWE